MPAPASLALVLAASDISAGPYLGLMVVGLLVGIFGHLIKSNLTVITGIGLILVSIVLLQVAIRATGT